MSRLDVPDPPALQTSLDPLVLVPEWFVAVSCH